MQKGTFMSRDIYAGYVRNSQVIFEDGFECFGRSLPAAQQSERTGPTLVLAVGREGAATVTTGRSVFGFGGGGSKVTAAVKVGFWCDTRSFRLTSLRPGVQLDVCCCLRKKYVVDGLPLGSKCC